MLCPQRYFVAKRRTLVLHPFKFEYPVASPTPFWACMKEVFIDNSNHLECHLFG